MKYKTFTIITIVVSILILLTTMTFAETKGTFQVVAGENDNAYLVNTETGAVWILTYRTLATGREPIAVPYKFLKIKPNDEYFLFEEYEGPSVEEKIGTSKKKKK